MSSDEEDCLSGDEKPSNKVAFDIASAVLFGNIDNNGFLTDDIFDEDCKKHLSSLQPHLDPLVPYGDIIESREVDNESENSDSENDHTSEATETNGTQHKESNNKPFEDTCKILLF